MAPFPPIPFFLEARGSSSRLTTELVSLGPRICLHIHTCIPRNDLVGAEVRCIFMNRQGADVGTIPSQNPHPSVHVDVLTYRTPSCASRSEDCTQTVPQQSEVLSIRWSRRPVGISCKPCGNLPACTHSLPGSEAADRSCAVADLVQCFCILMNVGTRSAMGKCYTGLAGI